MPKQITYSSIRSGQISKPPSRYDVGINKDIQILMSKRNEILAALD